MNLSTRVRNLEDARCSAFVRSLPDGDLMELLAIFDAEAAGRPLTADEQARYHAIMAPMEDRRE